MSLIFSLGDHKHWAGPGGSQAVRGTGPGSVQLQRTNKRGAVLTQGALLITHFHTVLSVVMNSNVRKSICEWIILSVKLCSFKIHGYDVLTGRNCNSVEAGGRELVWGKSREPAGDFPRGLCGGVRWTLYPTGHPCPLCHHHTYDR